MTTTGGPRITEAQAEPYEGSKARLAVGEFQDKTAKGHWEGGWLGMFGLTFKQIGDGMRDMLTTALFNTNRFIGSATSFAAGGATTIGGSLPFAINKPSGTKEKKKF